MRPSRNLGGSKLALVLGAALLAPGLADAALDEPLGASAEVTTIRVAGHAILIRVRGNVREYAADGRIFAARWRGRFAPDLRGLLGPYYAEYEEAMRARRPSGHSSLVLHTPSLELRSFTHMHTVQGALWLTARLPEGMTLDALP
jgi:hypothetical protein